MTTVNQLAPHTPTVGRRRERRAAHRPARDATTRRSFDGVVASYIRELAASGGAPPAGRPR